jgi:hypothetical protein
MKTPYYLIISLLFCFTIFTSCKRTPSVDPADEYGSVKIDFTHYVEGLPLLRDSFNYVNAAGNPYQVNNLMYFISDITLFKSDGTKKMIDSPKSIYYIDIETPGTLSWSPEDKILAGDYDSISFTFGINEEKNKSNLFVNPPEANMMWPDILGGGYHYMQMNGRWKDPASDIQLFSCHLGIGQLYKGNTTNPDSIYAFVQNYFRVSLPGSSLQIKKDQTTHFELRMNIDSWFKTPHIYDHNYWGGAIMQLQPAMQMLKENGYDVFSFHKILID